MGDKSKIEWTDASWNPVVGCSKLSPGCDNCYAAALADRFGWTPLPWTHENAAENVILRPDRLDQPLRWKKPRRVFVNSMSDLFHEQVPESYVRDVFETMARAPQHTFQILTKRPAVAEALFRKDALRGRVGASVEWPLPNVWVGVSIESWRFNWRADVLRRVPAAVRFISAEPLIDSLYPPADAKLGKRERALDLTGIDWLIVGGESGGRESRPMHPDWVGELRAACLATGCGSCEAMEYHDDQACSGPRTTAFFFKQWGSWAPDPYGSRSEATFLFPDGRRYSRMALDAYAPEGEGAMRLGYYGAGPKSGGRLLDGRKWDEMPDLDRQEAIA